MRSKLEIVLSALEDGQTVEIDGQKYCFGEDEAGKTVLCWELQRVAGDGKADTFIGRADVSFTYFYNACNKLSEEVIFEIAANNGLRKLVKERN